MEAFIIAVRTKFHDVTHLQTQTVAEWLSMPGTAHPCKNEACASPSEEESQAAPPHKAQITFFDVRGEKEYEISHIPGARRVSETIGDEDLYKVLEEVFSQPTSSDTPEPVHIVCYCSLGYRSSTLVQKIKKVLKDKNSSVDAKIYNLEGSIFKWANEDRELVTSSGEATKCVHPYNRLFGMAVRKELRKYEK